MSTVVVAEMRVADLDAEFRVNDIPVWHLRHRQAAFQAMPVHEFLVGGDNSLRIVVAGTPPERGSASIRIAGYPEGARAGEGGGQPIAQLDLATPDAAGQPVLGASGQFPLSSRLRWRWQDLAPVDWSAPPAVAAVTQFLQEFLRRLQAGDGGWLADVLRPRMTDYCTAYGMDPAQEVAEMYARIARRRADASFAVKPLRPEELALRPCAGGRLVECLLATGEPAIRWSDARVGPSAAWNLKLGVDQGRLQVYR